MPENAPSILAAAVASFLFGAAYYGLLGKPWVKARGWSPQDRPLGGRRPSPGPMAVSFIAELVMAIVLAGVIAHVAKHGATVRAGMMTGAICWLGFVATTIATNNAYGREKPALTFIDAAHWLGVLLLQGFVLGAIG